MDGQATADARRQALGERLALLARDGWRVESQGEFQAVLVKRKRPNHVLHLVLTIITGGLWLIVWLILALMNKERGRMVITVDEEGQIRGA